MGTLLSDTHDNRGPLPRPGQRSLHEPAVIIHLPSAVAVTHDYWAHDHTETNIPLETDMEDTGEARSGRTEGLEEAMDVRWLGSHIGSKVGFHWNLMNRVPGGAEFEGGCEVDLDGTVNYHALVKLRPGMDADLQPVDGDTTTVLTKSGEPASGLAREPADGFWTERLSDGKYMCVWGTGGTGEYVYIVRTDAIGTGEKGIRSGSTVWKPRSCRAWLDGKDERPFAQSWQCVRASVVDGLMGKGDGGDGGEGEGSVAVRATVVG